MVAENLIFVFFSFYGFTSHRVVDAPACMGNRRDVGVMAIRRRQIHGGLGEFFRWLGLRFSLLAQSVLRRLSRRRKKLFRFGNDLGERFGWRFRNGRGLVR